MRTKNSVKAKLQIMMNLCMEAKKLGDEICDMFEANDVIFDLLNSIQDCEITDIDSALNELEKYHCFEDSNITDVGESLYVPMIRYDNEVSLEVIKPCNGGNLIAYVSESDFKTSQAGVLWKKDLENFDYPFDLCMAEVLSGDLAEVHGKKPDNKDIDIICWGNVYDESYTDKTTINYDEIMSILEEEQ